jgi:Protein of unknown function (DUF1071)
MTTFEKLNAINLNGHIEKKNNLTYLSWAWAWAEVKKACPDATYKIGETEYDEVLGFMCHSSVTIEGETLDMWLPVMDGANQSMKKYGYEYATRYGNKSVAAATTFDINKTMMRCLVKNLAMFGLGLYIYAGEDLPEVTETPQPIAPIELKELKKGDENWIKVVKYVTENKGADSSVIIQQLSRKYKVSTALKKEITSLLS